MISLLANKTIPDLELHFGSEFDLTTYSHLSTGNLRQFEVLLCRANDKLTAKELINSKLKIIATASSGSDHIAKTGSIKVIDAKGANAQAVCDYILSTLATCDKSGIIQGKKLGIIGLGHVGSLVASVAKFLGFELFCCDPPKALSTRHLTWYKVDDLSHCDVITLHVPYTVSGNNATHHLIDESWLKKLKPGAILINTARGNIINEKALLKFNHVIYCCDVYTDEPTINSKIIDYAYLCTPHIAGHTIEAKKRATQIISHKIRQLLSLNVLTDTTSTQLNQTLKLSSWQQQALANYDPSHETQRLKQCPPLELRAEFTSARKAHKMRHDSNFIW